MKPAAFPLNEGALWRLAAGLLDGKAMLVICISAIIVCYAMLGYTISLGHWLSISFFNTVVGMTDPLAVAVFLGGALMLAVLHNAAHTYPHLNLIPNIRRVLRALMVRVAVVMLIASVPAIVFRAHMITTQRVSEIAQFSLHDITTVTYVKVTVYLLAAAIAIFATFGLLRAATRFAALPVMYSAMPFSSSGLSWLPFYVCAGIVGLKWFMQWIAQRHAMPAHPRAATASPGRFRASLNATGEFWQRWETRQLRRAARSNDARDGTVKRVTALLAPRRLKGAQGAAVAMAAVFIAVIPSRMTDLAATWPFTFLIAIVFLSQPPMVLSRIWLLPLGAARERMGDIFASVWMRSIRTPLVMCVLAAIFLKALGWSFGGTGQVNLLFDETNSMRFLWTPVAQLVALHGVIVSACLLVTAWPRTLLWATPPAAALFVVALLLGTTALALKWLINQAMPSTASGDDSLAVFVVVNGLVLPLIAWVVHYALRPTWKAANLAVLSAAMRAQEARQERSFSEQPNRLYAVKYPDGSIRHERL